MKAFFLVTAILLELIQQVHSQKSSFSINCAGTSYSDYVGDFGNTQPSWISVSGSANDGGGPEVSISGGGAANQALKTHKWGPGASSIKYTISELESGIWTCSLHFAEMSEDWNTVGKRVFNAKVTAGGVSTTQPNIDIMAAVGFKNAKSYSFTGLSVTRTITVDLTSVTGNPMISAITCAKTGETPCDGCGGGGSGSGGGGGSNMPAIIGGSIAALLLIIFVGILIYWFKFRSAERAPRGGQGRPGPTPPAPVETYY